METNTALVKPHPKALDINKIDLAGNRVSVTFKTRPERKVSLAQTAVSKGFTLSHYVEGLVCNAQDETKEKDRIIRQLKDTIDLNNEHLIIFENSQVETKEKDKIIQQLKDTIDLERLIIFENSNIDALFQKYNGEVLKYTDKTGKTKEQKIDNVEDFSSIISDSCVNKNMELPISDIPAQKMFFFFW